ncbi:hypothetical protein FRC11_014349 [Ceratobasidium sp. 423]|nr:hypothetical protein FRC11_014349 [Ceratobasidium sp. 423]
MQNQSHSKQPDAISSLVAVAVQISSGMAKDQPVRVLPSSEVADLLAELQALIKWCPS